MERERNEVVVDKMGEAMSAHAECSGVSCLTMDIRFIVALG